MKKLYSLFLGFIFACSSLFAQGQITNTVTFYVSQPVKSGTTNLFLLPQFNPNLGTLIKADVDLKTSFTHSQKFENLSDSFYSQTPDPEDPEWQVTPEFVAVAQSTNTVSSILFNAAPFYNSTNVIDVEAAYDGTTDFAGPSGGSSTNVDVQVLTFPVADLNAVTGTSNVNVSNKVSLRRKSTQYLSGTSVVSSAVKSEFWVKYVYTVPTQ